MVEKSPRASHHMSVVRGKDGEKRRPMLFTFVGNNRQMLREIRDGLSHVWKAPGDSSPANSPMPVRHEHTQLVSDSQVVAPPTGGAGGKSRCYTKNALAQIKQSLEGFQVNEPNSPGPVLPNGYDLEVQPVSEHLLRQLMQMGFDEDLAIRALKMSGNKSVDAAIDISYKLAHHEGRNGFARIQHPGLAAYGTGVVRKPSFEEKYRTGSPVNSENSSARSDSPVPSAHTRASVTNMQQPAFAAPSDRQTPPPPLPPRSSLTHGMNGWGTATPSQGLMASSQGYIDQRTGLLYQQQSIVDQRTGQVQHILMQKVPRDTVAVSRPTYGVAGGGPQRGMSPVMNSRQPVVISQQNMHSPNSVVPQHGPGRPMQVNGRISGNSSPGDGMPAGYGLAPMYYTVMTAHKSTGAATAVHPQLPVAGQDQFYIVQGDGSPLSSHSPSPASTPLQGQGHASPSPGILQPPNQLNGSRIGSQPVAVPAWSAKQPGIFMQQAKSREVQKPILQTATAPLSPTLPPTTNCAAATQQHNARDSNSSTSFTSSVYTHVNSTSNAQHQHHHGQLLQAPQPTYPNAPAQPYGNTELEITRQPIGGQPHLEHVGPSGPHSGKTLIHIQPHGLNSLQVAYPHAMGHTPGSTPRSESPLPRGMNQSPISVISTTSTPSTSSDIPDKPPPPYPGLGLGPRIQNLQYVNTQQMFRPLSPHQEEPFVGKHPSDDGGSQDSSQDNVDIGSMEPEIGEMVEKHLCTSPKPQRKAEAFMRDAERQETQVKHYSPQAFKFFIEQHVENVIKSQKQRELRRVQLEKEMARVNLSEEAQTQMRKMLYQKESNYIRLKRARMEKSMFEKIKTLGIGAFGEVALVRKRDKGHLYAMKTLRKRDVLSKNQVAHVKAERDILAEADNEWVVKLYYSFQDKHNLYFVMDYIPGGDMMSLLIKFGIFEEPLAQFYIAELVLAIESVHKMGFIHRDIKPDNILIDQEGHIKLTDFGLCTGFRWTHNSKYYQKGNHGRQDSMEPVEGWTNECNCDSEVLKPLERRKLRHQRCLAHSLVGTPNYIAPEVLLRSGYTRSCDWWSVGVILYEMLVGQPPFLANTPAETQLKVINWANALHIPPEAKLSVAACDLIVKLCCASEDRMGSNGVRELKQHPFFQGLSFDGLRQKRAPYIPQIRSPTDTSNFDEIPADKLRDVDSPEAVRKDLGYENGKHPEHAFLEFTFRRFFDETGQPFMPRFPDEPFLPLPSLPYEPFISTLPEEPALEGEETGETTPVYV